MIFRNDTRRPGAFTVTELLVSICLIGVLVAVLVSGLQSIRSIAGSTRCLNNLKEIAAGLLLYAGEHNGILPKTFDEETKTPWMMAISIHNNYLPSYRKDEHFQLWHCPSWIPLTVDDPRGKAPWLNVYGFVKPMGGHYDVIDRTLALHTPRTPLLADSLDEKPAGALSYQNYVAFADQPKTTWKIHLRHQGRANIAFADGHCESLNAEALTTLKVGVNQVSIKQWSERKSP